MEKLEEALNFINSCLKSFPRNPELLVIKGNTLVGSDRMEESLEAFDEGEVPSRFFEGVAGD